ADAALSWVEMVSPTEGWAGGTFESRNAGFLLHYRNGEWSQVATPDGLSVHQIQMLSPDEGWAIEVHLGDGSPRHFYLLHYSGGEWARGGPDDSSTVALSMVFSSGGWGAGGGGGLLPYQDGAGARWGQTTPADVTTLQMVSADDGWLAGTAPSWDAPLTAQHPFLMHFDGQRWSNAALPSLPQVPQNGQGDQRSDAESLPSTLSQMSLVSSADGWLV